MVMSSVDGKKVDTGTESRDTGEKFGIIGGGVTRALIAIILYM